MAAVDCAATTAVLALVNAVSAACTAVCFVPIAAFAVSLLFLAAIAAFISDVVAVFAVTPSAIAFNTGEFAIMESEESLLVFLLLNIKSNCDNLFVFLFSNAEIAADFSCSAAYA